MASTLQLRRSGGLPSRRFDLVVTAGQDEGRRFEDLTPPIAIGTGEGVQVRLSDPSVSRIHAEIEPGDGQAVLADRSSTNGTWLGGHRVLRAYLADGDRLRVGHTEVRVHTKDTARPAAMSERERFGELLGRSPPMRTLFALLERLAQVETPVLVRGETGVGKELVARSLHSEGPRAERPFVVFDCGAVAPNLVESELFGHRRGAFTGAERDRKGAFVEADGGTLFLDEIGELPLALQPKLLRALEARRIRAVGGDEERPVDVRLVAATHRDLSAMVNDGSFREDLYFRLAVFPLEVPPLRERPEDLPLLTRHFLDRALSGFDLEPVEGPDAESLRLLERMELKGNVRELRNLVERAVVLSTMEEIQRGRLAPALRLSTATGRRSERAPVTLEDAKRQFERGYLVALARRHGKDRQAAAAEAGVHPKSLGRLLRRHGLTHLEPDGPDPAEG